MTTEIALVLVILVLLLVINRQNARFDKKEERYLNRIMAISLEEYGRVTTNMEKSHDELMAEMEKENELASHLDEGTRGIRVI